MSSKTKTLFILHYSPPVHGAAKVGDTIVSSQSIKAAFNTRYIKIKSSSSIDEIGTLKIKKLGLLIELFFKIVFQLIYFRPQKIYYTASPSGFAFYRDLVMMIPLKAYALFRRKTNIYLHYHAKGIKTFTDASKISRRLTELLVKNTNIIFISDIMKSEVEALKSYKGIFVLNNGVASNLSDKDFESLLANKSKTNTVNVLYLSNMIKEKGYDKVLEIAKAQKNVNKADIHFHFAGSWSSKKDEVFFKQFVSKNNLENKVTYHGLVAGKTKDNLFKTSHMFVFPTTYKREVFPISILEALSYGLPVLTFNTGAIKEVMTKNTGIISDEKNLLEDFEALKQNYLNTNTYNLIRNHFLDNYTEAIFVEKLIHILKA